MSDEELEALQWQSLNDAHWAAVRIAELKAENARLRELLRDHGADPDGGQALGGTAG